MNDAIYKLKRYEDASLSYTFINKYKGESIGLYDTVLSPKDYLATFENVTKEKKTHKALIYIGITVSYSNTT